MSLSKDLIGKPIKIALIETEYGSVWCEEADYPGVRLTEEVELTFIARKPEEYVPEALAALDKQAKEAQAEYLTKMQGLNARRANLLAITHSIAEPAESEAQDGSKLDIGAIEDLPI